MRRVVIPILDEVLRNLGTFALVSIHLFSAVGFHDVLIADIFRLIESLEELHTEVMGVITYPHLSKMLLFNVSQQWFK